MSFLHFILIFWFSGCGINNPAAAFITIIVWIWVIISASCCETKHLLKCITDYLSTATFLFFLVKDLKKKLCTRPFKVTRGRLGENNDYWNKNKI